MMSRKELEELELQLETDHLVEGLERARQAQERMPFGISAAGTELAQPHVEPLVAAIETKQDEAIRDPHLPAGDVLLSFPADRLAAITIQSILTAMVESDDEEIAEDREADDAGDDDDDDDTGLLAAKETYLTRVIGEKCRGEWFNDLRRGRAVDLAALCARRYKDRKLGLRRGKKRAEKLKGLNWEKSRMVFHVGSQLLSLALKHSGIIRTRLRPRLSTLIELTPKAQARLPEIIEKHRWLMTPRWRPMVVPPRPWNGSGSGGYLHETGHTLVKPCAWARTADYSKADLTKVCEAVNVIQETPWRINRDIRGLLATAWERKSPEAAIPSFQPPTLPPRLPKKTTPKKEFKRRQRERAHCRREAREVARNAIRMEMRLGLAADYEKYEEIWNPHNGDRRGRLYSIPQIVQPQADDKGRALLQFAHAKPLGERGAWWLAVYLANLYGDEKGSFDQRVRWVREHEDAILDSARRPLDSAGFWLKAKKQWRFLAAAREWAGYCEQGPSFPSVIPIAMDGTCNGLQHLSALGRDEAGGRWTNLLRGDAPQDIYREVADRLVGWLDRAAAEGDSTAAAWRPLVNRDLTKPATMTIPYGVGEGRMRQQILEHLRGLRPKRYFDDDWDAATMLVPFLAQSISEVVVKASELMRWLQAVAGTLAGVSRPLEWTVPTGFPLLHHYPRMRGERVRLVTGTPRLKKATRSLKLNLSKQVNAIVANLVHSLDAAHLMMTVRELKARGVTDVSVVHDSFAVHACDVDVMNEVLREQFVRLHTEFTLGTFWKSVKAAAPRGVALPEPPATGALDLAAVRTSEYFFA